MFQEKKDNLKGQAAILLDFHQMAEAISAQVRICFGEVASSRRIL